MEAGLIVILAGVIFLLKDLGLLVNVDWSIIWPLLVILIGLIMVTGKPKRRRAMECVGKKCDHCDHRER